MYQGFQPFMDSAAIEMDVFEDLFFDLVFSQAGLIMKSTRSRMSISRL